jgi:uncharacterized protein (TIGR01777 family)
MEILITGATGFIGKHLGTMLIHDGHAITVVTRDIAGARKTFPGAAAIIDWEHTALKAALDSTDAVINLAGEPIASGRWTSARKAAIMNSRILAAQRLTNAVAAVKQRPSLFIQASAIGYYGNRGDEECTEDTAPGEGFLADVCKKWEAGIPQMETLVERVVTIRIGVVLGRQGGMMHELLKQSKRCLAGIAGNGRQWISWIHIDDLVRAIACIMNDEKARGVFNLVAPAPVRQKEFVRLLKKATGRKLQLGAPGFVIRSVLGQMGRELLLSGQKVLPDRLQRQGYQYKFDDAGKAVDAITARPEHDQ